MAKDNVMDFNLEDFNFEELSSEIFGDNVTTAKLNPDLQGKIFAVYGTNNTGKTTQCAKMVKNSFLIPFEKGVNALTGTQILKTSNWADAKRHVRMLTTNKKLLNALKAGHTIGVILDGLENMSVFAKQYICDQAGVEKFSKAGAHGSQWEEYANEIFNMVTKLSQCGYTLFFIGHSAESKEESGYMDFACDKRTAKPIKDVADFVFYLRSNGTDPETGKVIPSSAYLSEHLPSEEEYGWFSRCRFPYISTYFEQWNADIIKQAIHDGIVEQAEIEGAEIVGFAEVTEKYESTFTMTIDEVKDAIFDKLEECDQKGLTEKADDILLTYLDTVDQVEVLKERQLQIAQTILDELSALVE